MKICIEIPKNEEQLIEDANKLDEVTIKQIHPLGATEYIAIFVPLTMMIANQIPWVIENIIANKNVVVRVKGRTIKGKPEDIIKEIKKIPAVQDELQILMKNGEIEIEGKADKVAATDQLLNKLMDEDIQNES